MSNAFLMRTRPLALLLGFFLAAVPFSHADADPTPPPVSGADLGIATSFAIADTVPACGAGMVTQDQISACQSAVQNHQLIFTWHFSQNACSAAPCAVPDGFNIVRSDSNGATVIQTANGSDRGAILKITAAEVAGSCFSVLPFHGTNDYGRKSNTVCITIVDNETLAPTSVFVAHGYHYVDGTFGKSPSSNPVGYTIGYKQTQMAGPNMTVGYLDRRSVSGTLTVSEYYDVYQGLVRFDLSKLAGKTIRKATFTANVARSGYNAGGGAGGGGMNPDPEGSEDPAPRSCATTIGFPRNYVAGGAVPAVVEPDVQETFLPQLTSTFSVDVTNMVRAWLSPRGVNNGLVLTSKFENFNDYNAAWGKGVGFNADCMTLYSTMRLRVEYGA